MLIILVQRAICRLPGERIFNTRGAPGSPRVFTSAANTAATVENYRQDYTACVSHASEALRGGGVAEYARVAISSTCMRARG